MKKYLCMGLILACSATTYAESEIDIVQQALKGDYQTQRNLAYSYKQGSGVQGDSGYIPQSAIHACAWRKIIILSNPSKIDDGDFGNEAVDCKAVDVVDNKNVWLIVFTALRSIPKK
ncbi:Uncharacterised protein [Yersinia frederiksenii]|uniref:hypothetical protein n=1 Tax=Yersinia proxima TaxID=2890316 RepID=UPI0005DF2167|nr:hypothetical protein [Yersinia proxima]CNK22906.1 Uncharacterised protein [Yersinia frederiksenii]